MRMDAKYNVGQIQTQIETQNYEIGKVRTPQWVMCMRFKQLAPEMVFCLLIRYYIDGTILRIIC